jgi:hypothetical protein
MFSHGFFETHILEAISALLILAFVYPAPVLLLFLLLVRLLTYKNYNQWLCKFILSFYLLFVLYIGNVIFYCGLYNGELSWRVLVGRMYEALDFYHGDWLLFGVPTLFVIWVVKFPKENSESNAALAN